MVQTIKPHPVVLHTNKKPAVVHKKNKGKGPVRKHSAKPVHKVQHSRQKPVTTQPQQNPAPAGQQYGSSFIQACLQIQNEARAQVGAPPLVWDQNLANHAQDWSGHMAQLGHIEHSVDAGEGESIYGPGLPSADDACRDAARIFTSERGAYEQAGRPAIDPATFGPFGHYTQAIWKSTTSMGCGVSVGVTGGQFVTCRYFPPGNVIGQRPY